MKKIHALLMPALCCTILLGSCEKDDYHNTHTTTTNTNTGNGTTTTGKSFNDQFNQDDHNWTVTNNTDSVYVNIISGNLKYSYLKSTGRNRVVVNTGLSFKNDFVLKTRIKSNNVMGIVFGSSTTSNGYSFMVDDKGYFAVYNEGDSATAASPILTWQYAPAIESGWNDVRFEQAGEYWTGYINDTKVFQIQSMYLPTGKAGFVVLNNTVGYADYLTVQ